MKNLIFLLALALPFTIKAQENNYIQFESVILTPHPAKIPELRENMRAHNLKFHTTAPYEHRIYNVSAGKNPGDIVVLMGPATFADLDARPGGEEHGKDWVGNILPNCTASKHAEYWRVYKDMSVNPSPAGAAPSNMVYVRYMTVKPGEGYRMGSLLKMLKATIEKLDNGKSWTMYENMFRQGSENGRHLAVVTPMDNWAEIDEDEEFVKAFESVHGKGTFTPWNRGMQAVFINVWDEVWTYNAYMSGK